MNNELDQQVNEAIEDLTNLLRTAFKEIKKNDNKSSTVASPSGQNTAPQRPRGSSLSHHSVKMLNACVNDIIAATREWEKAIQADYNDFDKAFLRIASGAALDSVELAAKMATIVKGIRKKSFLPKSHDNTQHPKNLIQLRERFDMAYKELGNLSWAFQLNNEVDVDKVEIKFRALGRALQEKSEPFIDRANWHEDLRELPLIQEKMKTWTKVSTGSHKNVRKNLTAGFSGAGKAIEDAVKLIETQKHQKSKDKRPKRNKLDAN